MRECGRFQHAETPSQEGIRPIDHAPASNLHQGGLRTPNDRETTETLQSHIKQLDGALPRFTRPAFAYRQAIPQPLRIDLFSLQRRPIGKRHCLQKRILLPLRAPNGGTYTDLEAQHLPGSPIRWENAQPVAFVVSRRSQSQGLRRQRIRQRNLRRHLVSIQRRVGKQALFFVKVTERLRRSFAKGCTKQTVQGIAKIQSLMLMPRVMPRHPRGQQPRVGARVQEMQWTLPSHVRTFVLLSVACRTGRQPPCSPLFQSRSSHTSDR